MPPQRMFQNLKPPLKSIFQNVKLFQDLISLLTICLDDLGSLMCMNVMLQVLVGIHPLPSPRLTIWFLAMMMKLNYIGGTIPDLIRLTQHEAQYTITTLMGHIYLGY